jgi:hypothetical protein
MKLVNGFATWPSLKCVEFLEQRKLRRVPEVVHLPPDENDP